MTPAPPVPALHLGDADSGRRIAVRPGQAIELRLRDPTAAQPDWTLTQGPPGVVVTGRGFSAGGGRSPFEASGVDVIRMRVAAPAGRTVPLRLDYRLSTRPLTLARVWRVSLQVVEASQGPLRR